MASYKNVKNSMKSHLRLSLMTQNLVTRVHASCHTHTHTLVKGASGTGNVVTLHLIFGIAFCRK